MYLRIWSPSTVLKVGQIQSMPQYTASVIGACQVLFTGAKFLSEISFSTEYEY